MSLDIKYKKLIQANKIKVSELPNEVKQAITKLEDLIDEWDDETEGSEEQINLGKEILTLDKSICKLIEDFDEESEIEDEKEAILEYFFDANVKKISKEMLKAKGYPVDDIGTGETVGDYKLCLHKPAMLTSYYTVHKK
ncbi:MAG: hypothetical protein RLZZ175_2759 [Bacteroidota bacterium]|jgi:predicted RNase H-like nuclease (RuvC/YqgF family)